DGSANVLHLPAAEQECSVHGTWKQQQGMLTVANKAGTFVINPFTLTLSGSHRTINLAGTFPLEYATRLGIGSTTIMGLPVAASCGLQAKLAYDAQQQPYIHGHLNVNNIMCNQQNLDGQARISFNKKNMLWKGGL